MVRASRKPNCPRNGTLCPEYLYVFVGLPERLEPVGEAGDVPPQLVLLGPQHLFVEADELQETLGGGVVVPALVLQELPRHLPRREFA